MIFVDTSVWIAAFRGTNHPLRRQLDELLDLDAVAVPVPVRVEILAGCKPKGQAGMREMLSALPTFYPSTSTWASLDRWIETATRSGHQFALGDLLIAAITSEQKGRVWSLDEDFARLKKLKLVETYDLQ